MISQENFYHVKKSFLNFSIKTHNSIFTSLFISSFVFFVYFPFAKLDFDRHHDGLMVAIAIAASQGFKLGPEVDAGYGLVTAWIQGFFINLDIFGPLLTIRILNVIFISLIVFFMCDLSRVAPETWQINSSAMRLSAVTWILLCDLWVGVVMLPWPSVVVCAMVASALYFLAIAAKFHSDKRETLAILFSFVSGIIFGLGIFTRINVGLISISGIIFVLLVFAIGSPSDWRKIATTACSGILVSVIFVCAFLVISSSWSDYLNQAIIGPRKWATKNIEDWNTIENIVRMLIQQSTQVLLIFFAYNELIVKKIKFYRSKIFKICFYILLAVIISSSQIILSLFKYKSRQLDQSINFMTFISIIFENYLEFFLVVVIWSLLLVLIRLIRISRSKFLDNLVNNSGLTLLSVIAFSLIAQIVPTWDTRHIWWGLPFGLAVFFSLIKKNLLLTSHSIPIFFQIGFILIIGLISSQNYKDLKREPEIPVESIAKGMSISAHEVAWLAADAEFLRNQIGLTNKAIYLTWNGYVAVINGKYTSADPYLTVLGFPPDLENRILNKPPIVVEDAIITSALVDELNSMGYVEVSNNLHLFIFKYRP